MLRKKGRLATGCCVWCRLAVVPLPLPPAVPGLPLGPWPLWPCAVQRPARGSMKGASSQAPGAGEYLRSAAPATTRAEAAPLRMAGGGTMRSTGVARRRSIQIERSAAALEPDAAWIDACPIPWIGPVDFGPNLKRGIKSFWAAIRATALVALGLGPPLSTYLPARMPNGLALVLLGTKSSW